MDWTIRCAALVWMLIPALGWGQDSVSVISNTAAVAADEGFAHGSVDSMRLPPPSEEPKKSSPVGNDVTVTVLSSLAIVLGLFCGLIWISRKAGPLKSTGMPKEVFEVLGTAPLDARHQAMMVRCGGRILLIGATQNNVSTLSEIREKSEVDEVLDQFPGKAKQQFTETFERLSKTEAAAGFVEQSPPTALFSRDR